jgi:predicted RNase H-like HicB family nuclease
MKTKKLDTVELERDSSGWWVATLVGAPGCHTQGRSIAQAMTRIREAADVCEAPIAEVLKPVFRIGALTASIEATKKARHDAARAEEHAAKATAKMAKTLERKGYSRRDIGALLGMSFQRAHQLAGG